MLLRIAGWLKRVSAMLLAVFLCVTVFAGYPIEANAVNRDNLAFGPWGQASFVSYSTTWSLLVKNDNGFKDLKELRDSGVTATITVSDNDAIKVEKMNPTDEYPYPYIWKITYLKAGVYHVYCTLSNGMKFDFETRLIQNPFKDMWFPKTTMSIKVGETVQLTYDYNGEFGPKPITDPPFNLGYWKSSNTKVATVDSNGNVTGISEGVATITFTLPNYKIVKEYPNLTRDLEDYVISCNVAVSKDGKATAPAPTTTTRPATTTKVTQATKKNTNTTQSTAKKTDTAVTHVAGVSSTGVAQTTIHTTTTENYKTDLETTTSGTEETSTTGAPAYGESKSQSNGTILLAAVIIVILGGGASIFILVRKTRSR